MGLNYPIEALLSDPSEEIDNAEKLAQAFDQAAALINGVDADMAVNAANFTRLYPTATGELTAAIALAGQQWDSPWLKDIVDLEAREGWLSTNLLTRALKQGSRIAFATVDSIWDNGLNRQMRVIKRMNDGEDLLEAFRKSGSTMAGAAMRAHRLGQDYTLGDGWIPGPTESWDHKPFRDAYVNKLDAAEQQYKQTGQPYNLEQIYDQAFEEATPPLNLWDTSRRSFESTRFQSPHGGPSVPISFGRVTAGLVVRPETMPSVLLSGYLDAGVRIGWDPLNTVADELTLAMRNRNILIPSGVTADDLGKQNWRWWLRPKFADEWIHSDDAAPVLQAFVDGDIADVAELAPDLPIGTMRQLARASTPQQVRKLLLPHLGIRNHRRAYSLNRSQRLQAKYPAARRHLGARTMFDESAGPAGGWVLLEDESDMGRNLRRWTARIEQGHLVLDRHNPHATLKKVRAYMETFGATKEEIANTLWAITTHGLKVDESYLVPYKIKDALAHALERAGAPDDYIIDVMNHFLIEQRIAKTYIDDMTGNVVVEVVNKPFTIRGAKDEAFEVNLPMAPNEAMFVHRNEVLPAAREVRAVTSKFRVTMDKRRVAQGKRPVGFDENMIEHNWQTWLRYKLLDPGMAIWRNLALARLGWPLRVLPDEWLRIVGSGYSAQFMDPAAYIAYMIGIKGNFDHSAWLQWDEWLEAKGGLGTGTLSRNLNNEQMDLYETTRGLGANKSHTSIEMFDARGDVVPAAKMALFKRIALLRQNRLAHTILVHDGNLEAAARWLLTTPEGRAIRDDIAPKAGANSVLHRIGGEKPNPNDVIRALEMTEGDIRRHVGGSFVRRKIDRVAGNKVTTWVDEYGREIPTWDPSELLPNGRKKWTGAALDEELKARGIPHSRYKTVEDKRRALFEAEGLPYLDDLPEDQIWVFGANSNPGNPQVRHVIQTGRTIDPIENWDDIDEVISKLSPEEAYPFLVQRLFEKLLIQYQDEFRDLMEAYEFERIQFLYHAQELNEESMEAIVALMAAGFTEDEALHVLRATRQSVDEAASLSTAQYRQAAEEIVIANHFDELPESARNWVLEGTEDVDDLRARVAKAREAFEAYPELLQSNGKIRPSVDILDNKTMMDISRSEELLIGLYDDDFPLPPTVIGHTGERPDRVESVVKHFVDNLFWAIGGYPTIKFMRSPLFKVKYIEQLAGYYIWTDDATRRTIMQLMDEHHATEDFTRFLNRQLKEHKLNKVPMGPNRIGLTFEELDEISRMNALEEVKSLLYDLSESNNVADATRLIFPFGDAWFEVLSRWGRLLNPWKNQGQAIRNWRRPQQFFNTANQEGWFSEDAYGNSVFNLPVPFGIDTGTQGFQMAPKVGINQFMFIDPGNPMSVILPGWGPVVQAPGAWLRYVLPVSVRDMFDKVIYGDFPPPETGSPTDWLTATMPTVFRRTVDRFHSDEFREEYATEQVQAYYGFCLSKDSRFDCSTVEGQQRAKREAEKVASTLGWLRIWESVAYPALPQWTPEVNLYEGLPDEFADFWVSVSALGAEYALARERFGPLKAQEYFMNKFGQDPLNIGASTTAIKPSPTTKKQALMMEEFPQLLEYADLTLMAFLPDDPDGEFYGPLWQWQKNTGRRVNTTIDIAQQEQNLKLAQRQFENTSKLYDDLVARAEQDYAGLPHTRRKYLQELRAWKTRVTRDIGLEWTEFTSGSSVEGRVERATAMGLLNEIVNDHNGIGLRGSVPNRELTAVNPELVGFMEHLRDAWRQAETIAVEEKGLSVDWWRTSESETTGADIIRQWFVNELRMKAATLKDPIARSGAEWIADRILTALLVTYDMNQPLMLEMEVPPLPPTTPVLGDTLTTGASK